MDEAALKELGTRYDLAALRARVPREAPQLRAFDAAALQVDGWRVSVSETLRTASGRPWRRVVFDALDAPAMRVLIDVVECASPAEALDELLERLAGNQLARLDDGPPQLGFAAFQHPAAAPPAIFFALNNLCIAVASFGSRRAEVLPWAERYRSRVVEPAR
ncbi:MAG: hypothetical protein KJ025_05675 [Burkholderiales bacterium]|nr:hypothetical protein [Burkholderiales bacterium]